ncbi:MAG: YtxH domain-containing protein [Actinomyces urogenitalis]|uniref:YtxH domain-containing protein n=1 Tax=Actinomyces urogenitalis TaxID=103621 RepID=UPI00242F1E3E|nr:YtxH domain-containing protein [Actinomyces urogenitalis]MCI7456871.1 YtxH domain-containing protein [Actinomyces urogenitalis]MDY3678660.1 YtxH domain-containing protein [Actinomyces urogenitalis]
MASKIPFILGLGAGYVLGTRAGRAQYERIKAAAARVAEQPFVREKVDSASAKATSFARQQGEALTDKVVDAVKERLFGAPAQQSTAPAQPIEVDDAEVRSV